ncbi:MAG: hypothetical protein ABFD60_09655 [Bryobacteraceae bacterium]
MVQFAHASNWMGETVELLLILSLLSPSLVAKPPAQTPKQMKEIVAKVGTGEKAQVKVAMKAGKSLKGYISSSDETGITLVTKEQTRTLTYLDMNSIEKKGLHPAIWAGIVAGIVAGILIAIYAAGCGGSGC